MAPEIADLSRVPSRRRVASVWAVGIPTEGTAASGPGRILSGSIALALCVAFSQPASGQRMPDRPVPVQVQPLLQVDDAAMARPTLTTRAGRRDALSGVDRASYRPAPSQETLVDTTPVATRPRAAIARLATAYLDANRLTYGWADAAEELDVFHVARSTHAAHVTFRQQFENLPVHDRYVRISLDAHGQPSFVVSGFDATLRQRIEAAGGGSAFIRPRVSRDAAADRAALLFGGPVEFIDNDHGNLSTLVVVPNERPLLAWRLYLSSDAFPGDWEVLIDAKSGEPIRVRDRALRRRQTNVIAVEAAAPRASIANSHSHLVTLASGDAPLTTRRVDGTGHVFEPDPLTSAGAPYGVPYIDDNDADLAALNAQLVDVSLNDIEEGTDGLYRLNGPYVRIVGGGGYSPPVESSPDGFAYSRGNDDFEAVSAYYHVDASQRYVQSLGFTDIQSAGVSVSPRAIVADNSLYLPSSNQLNFGIGGVDDAEDAGVVWHEYGHALLQAAAPGLVDGGEGQALHEGWADYWAGSYLRGLAEAGKSARLDWESVFRWDSGDGQIWPGRTIGVDGIYPDDTTCDDLRDTEQDGCDFYADGLIWASALMEIFDVLGKTVTDRLNLQSHKYIVAPATFRDAAAALLRADQDLFGGANASTITSRLVARGFLEDNSAAPLVDHKPLKDSEALGGSVPVRAQASSSVASIDSVRIVFRWPGANDVAVRLSEMGGSQYGGPLPLPVNAGIVQYQLEVYDSEGRIRILPETAPAIRYAFYVGPDTTRPVIDHTPLEAISTILWPPSIVANVTDNLGLATVTLDYALHNADGSLRLSGSVEMASGTTGDLYQSALPFDRSDVEEGSTIRYSIEAMDASQAGNVLREPAVGEHLVAVTSSGELLAWDFENTAGAASSTGVWELGAPISPLSVSHSGLRSWSTGLEAPYPAESQRSSLTLPPLDLSGTAASLVFWHWHDFEHRGTLEPESSNPNAILWDGGNVKISVDGGPFEVATPVGGYSGTIASSTGNPMGGESAFGGYSYGWRRVVLPLPQASSVRVRFDFGTDSANDESSVAFAGWFIDDVVVSTSLAIDNTPPILDNPPPARIVRPASQPAIDLEVRVIDDVGAARVEFVPESGQSLGLPVTPLAQRFDNLQRYATTVQPATVQAGDRLAYRLRIVDFAGNETIVPATGVPAFVIDFRTIESVNALQDAAAGGSWMRESTSWLSQAAVEAPGGGPFEQSALVLAPMTLADNVEELVLVLTHSYEFDEASGGNVKVSDDDGQTWELLVPAGGYPDVWESGAAHANAGEGVFRGSVSTAVDTFDVSGYAGRRIRVRMDAGYTDNADDGTFWSVEAVTAEAVSLEPDLNVQFDLTLDANFPDPFSVSTTITYAIPDQALVNLSVYDVLGRRVRVLRYQEQAPGEYTVELQADGMASGVYFLQLAVGNRRVIEQMVVAR